MSRVCVTDLVLSPSRFRTILRWLGIVLMGILAFPAGVSDQPAPLLVIIVILRLYRVTQARGRSRFAVRVDLLTRFEKISSWPCCFVILPHSEPKSQEYLPWTK